MKREAGTGKTLSGWAMALLLVLCCVSGLAAGVLTSSLTGTAGTRVLGATSPGRGSPAATDASTVTPSPTSSVSASTRTPVLATGFTVSVDVSPAQVAPGATFTVTATVLSATSTPIAGVQCYMRAPSDGSPSLYQDMPAPQFSDANGQATWTLVVPQVSPRTYRIEVIAYGSGKYFYFGYAHLTVTAS